MRKKKLKPPVVTLVCSLCGELCEDNFGLPAAPLSSGRSCLRCGPKVRQAIYKADLKRVLSISLGKSKPNPKTLVEPITTDISYPDEPAAPALKTYLVEVLRTGYSCRTLEIQAENEEQAASLAEDEAGNYEYSEHTSEYEIESVREKADERMIKEYGERCPTYTAHCISCEAWRYYDKFGKCPTAEQIDIWIAAMSPCDPDVEEIPWSHLTTK